MFSIWGVGIAASPYVPGSRARRLRVDPATRSRPSRRHVAGESIAEAPLPDGSDHERARSEHAAAYDQASAGRPHRREAVTAADLMSAPVVTIASGATLATAAALFRKRRFRHVPVCEPAGTLVGILSDRDLLREVALPEATIVAEIMTTPVLTAHPETSIREVARVMFEEHLGATPIVDAAGTLVGIMTRSDILRALVNRAPLELWA